MAIAYDNTTFSDDGGGAVTSRTFSHTCTGSNLALLVGVEGSTVADRITGVTYNSVAMTQLSAYKGSGGRWIYIYGLLAPATGANNVVVSCSPADIIGTTATSYTGVKQSGLPDNIAQSNGAAGLTDAASITPSADNCWVMMFSHGTVISSAGANTTLRANGSGYGWCDGNALVHPAASTTLNIVTLDSGNTGWSNIIMSLAPATASVINPRLALLGVG